jgi:hypothetical protein
VVPYHGSGSGDQPPVWKSAAHLEAQVEIFSAESEALIEANLRDHVAQE